MLSNPPSEWLDWVGMPFQKHRLLHRRGAYDEETNWSIMKSERNLIRKTGRCFNTSHRSVSLAAGPDMLLTRVNQEHANLSLIRNCAKHEAHNKWEYDYVHKALELPGWIRAGTTRQAKSVYLPAKTLLSVTLEKQTPTTDPWNIEFAKGMNILQLE
jgi:hypothetical protein